MARIYLSRYDSRTDPWARQYFSLGLLRHKFPLSKAIKVSEVRDLIPFTKDISSTLSAGNSLATTKEIYNGRFRFKCPILP